MTTNNKRIAEIEARNERLEHEYRQWSSSLATLHADLDAVGVEGADYRTCNDPTCNSKIVHRVRALLALLKRKSAALEEENKRLKADLLAECAKAVRYGGLVDWMASEEANSCTVYDPARGEYITPLMAYGQERARRAFKESSDAK